VPGEGPFLEVGKPVNDEFRRAVFLGSGFMLEGPPAEEAPLGAPEGGGHLDAAVALDPVELVLVAHLPAAECLLAPEAGLHRRR
jgi:hypothetical protein